jgi:hypothetical protein
MDPSDFKIKTFLLLMLSVRCHFYVKKVIPWNYAPSFRFNFYYPG